MLIQGNKFQIKHSFVAVLFTCVLVTYGSRRGKGGGWNIVILGWMMAPGQEAGSGQGEGWRQEGRGATLVQKRNKRPVFRI